MAASGPGFELSKLIATAISCKSGGQRIGEIENVLANADNQIVAVVIEYDDGFLDLNGPDVILPIDQIRFDQNAASVTLGDAELRALPVWDD